MGCCKKAFGVGLVAAGVLAAATLTGWGSFAVHKARASLKKAVPPQVQIDRIRHDISKLDRDIDKNWTPIARREQDIKDLDRDVDGLRAYLDQSKADMLAATADLKSGVKRISYKGSERSEADVRKQLVKDATTYQVKSRELSAKETLRAAWKRELDAAMKQQDEMKALKGELEARLATIEADLKVLELSESKGKLPVGNGTRLDEIKANMDEMEREINIRTRENELRTNYNEKYETPKTTVPTKDKVDSTDDVIKKVQAATGEKIEVGNGD